MAVRGWLRQKMRDYIPRQYRQSAKDITGYRGTPSGQWGYESPQRRQSVYDPLGGRAQVSGQVAGATQDYNVQQPLTSTGGATGGATRTATSDALGTEPYMPRYVTFLGAQYDVNDPNQFYALKNAQLDYTTQLYGQNLGTLSENLFKTTGYRGTETPIGLENVGGDIGRQKTSFLQNILDTLGDYGVREKENLGNIGAYYSGLGDITQSSQAVMTGAEQEKFTGARTRLERSKQEGLTSLERALQDYLGGYTQDVGSVATQYQTARDEVANQTDETIQEVADNVQNLQMQYNNAAYSGQDPTFIKEEIARNRDILNGLLGLRGGNIFRKFGKQGAGADIPAILKYLYPQGA